MTPRPNQRSSNDPDLDHVLALIRRSFAYMDGRIAPPSSMRALTVASIARQCEEGEVWTLGAPAFACIFLTEKPDCLYLGKLAVDLAKRGQGHGRTLVRLAEIMARARALDALELETRIELVDNHQAFARMGFVKIGEGRHEGFARPTFVTMRKMLIA